MVRSRERPIANQRRRIEGQEQKNFLHRREQEVVRIEAKQQVEETEVKANVILDEQRRAFIEQASYEFHAREAQSGGTVQHLKAQLRQQDVELCSKIQVYEKSRQEQYLLRAELTSRERSHRDVLSYARDVVAKLRKTKRSEAELREEACQDAISQEGENILDHELRERQSTVENSRKKCEKYTKY